MSIKDFFSKLLGKTKETTKQAYDKAEDFADKTLDSLEDKAEIAFEQAKTWTETKVQEAKNVATETLHNVQESELYKATEQKAEAAWDKAKEISQDVVDSAQELAAKATDKIEDLTDRIQGDDTPVKAAEESAENIAQSATENPTDEKQV